MSTYRGDSPGKKLSRFRTWVLATQAARTLQIPYQGSMVLAGEGGDLSVLEAMGTPMNTVTAVDFDGDWLEYCDEVYPGVKTVKGEAGAASAGIQYSMAHLDFCGGLSAANIKTVADVCWNVKALPSIVAVTMLKGREYMGGPREDMLGKVPRTVRRRALLAHRKIKDDIGEYVLSTPKLDPRHLLSLAEERLRETMPFSRYKDFKGQSPYRKNGKLSALGSAFIRAIAMQRSVEAISALNGDDPFDGPSLTCVGVVGYHSRTKTDNGTPFLTAIYCVSHRAHSEMTQQVLMTNTGNFMFDSLDTKECLEQLAPTAAELAKVIPAKKVAKMFDVQPATVVAWKAHAARGTYKVQPLLRASLRGEVPTGRPTFYIGGE